jgi:hypothetical protein
MSVRLLTPAFPKSCRFVSADPKLAGEHLDINFKTCTVFASRLRLAVRTRRRGNLAITLRLQIFGTTYQSLGCLRISCGTWSWSDWLSGLQQFGARGQHEPSPNQLAVRRLSKVVACSLGARGTIVRVCSAPVGADCHASLSSSSSRACFSASAAVRSSRNLEPKDR